MFAVAKSFYLMQRDLIVFTGELVEGELGPGMTVDLLAEKGGPGNVPIHTVESVKFADGSEQLAITVLWDTLAPVPLFEPSSLEGETLPVAMAD